MFELFLLYFSDKMFPALGFGARLPPDGRVSHEFFLVSYTLVYCLIGIVRSTGYVVKLLFQPPILMVNCD